ncbi:hypothetical protein F2Q69_00005480 [Brassica cretica]|uniref:Uncharacterized protein n=1 Tax=Brassica cretica TaxID=69181 RepID=A0A8S9NVQ6_BRACR|nr:hypothetical protein F2Q69_00005480 [Brassica cretica]
MDSRRWEPGIREEMRAGTETTTGQNRGDLIRGRGVRMETGSFFCKKISGRYRFGGMEGIWISFSISINTRLRRSRASPFLQRLFAICIDCLKFWIINGDLVFWYMGSSIRNGLSVWKIMEQWVKTIQGRGDCGHTTVVWVVLLRGEQNGLRWFGLVNWCGRRKYEMLGIWSQVLVSLNHELDRMQIKYARRKYEMLGIWSQVLVSLNHELDRMQIKYARYYVWCCARVSIWYLETADGSWYAAVSGRDDGNMGKRN